MKSYEGMFIVKSDLTKDNLEKTVGQIKDIISKNEGSLSGEIKEMGKQRLAYPIKKLTEGMYYLLNFHIEPSAISKLKRSFSLNESIVRVLIVKQG